MSDLGHPLTFATAAEAPETLNILLYGPPKAGKSTAAATAPGPILWVNLEGGNALSYPRKVATERGTEIHEVRVEHHDRLGPILRSVLTHVQTGTEPRVKTVVIDTMGKVRDHLARNVGGNDPKIHHWKEVARIIEGLVKELRDAPVNSVLLAHEDIQDDAETGRIVEPLIGGKTTAKVAGEVDVIAYCGRLEDESGVRYMGQLVEGKGRRAGERSGGALGTTRELDLTEWLATYRGALTPDRDEREQVLFGEQPG